MGVATVMQPRDIGTRGARTGRSVGAETSQVKYAEHTTIRSPRPNRKVCTMAKPAKPANTVEAPPIETDKSAQKPVNPRLAELAALGLPTTSESLGLTVGAFIVASSVSSLVALRTKADNKTRTERDAAMTHLPKEVQAAFRTIERFAVNAENGIAAVDCLTIPDGFGIFSGKNGAQIARDYFSPANSATDIRKAALGMASTLCKVITV